VRLFLAARAGMRAIFVSTLLAVRRYARATIGGRVACESAPAPTLHDGRISMKGDPKVIAHLNKALFNELTAINQYFLHARMYRNWGYKELAEHEYKESIDEMKHADRLIERILFLDGLPNLQALGKLLIGESPKEALACDLKLEMLAVPDLKAAIADCEALGDYVSRELFEDILESEEEHIDWLETQLGLIDRLGETPYLQTKIGS
jgi:bacterioferritin